MLRSKQAIRGTSTNGRAAVITQQAPIGSDLLLYSAKASSIR